MKTRILIMIICGFLFGCKPFHYSVLGVSKVKQIPKCIGYFVFPSKSITCDSQMVKFIDVSSSSACFTADDVDSIFNKLKIKGYYASANYIITDEIYDISKQYGLFTLIDKNTRYDFSGRHCLFMCIPMIRTKNAIYIYPFTPQKSIEEDTIQLLRDLQVYFSDETARKILDRYSEGVYFPRFGPHPM